MVQLPLFLHGPVYSPSSSPPEPNRSVRNRARYPAGPCQNPYLEHYSIVMPTENLRTFRCSLQNAIITVRSLPGSDRHSKEKESPDYQRNWRTEQPLEAVRMFIHVNTPWIGHPHFCRPVVLVKMQQMAGRQVIMKIFPLPSNAPRDLSFFGFWDLSGR